MKLSSLISLVRDAQLARAHARQPRTREEWYADWHNVRAEIHDKLAYCNERWVMGKCENYSAFPRGYAVVLISLVNEVATFQASHYALTMAFVRASQKFAMLESLTAESPFRPIVRKRKSSNTLLELTYDQDTEELDANEDRYNVNDRAWRTSKHLRQSEDYDDYEARQETYLQMMASH